MRIEDLDGPRVRPGAAESSLDTLKWLGMDWDSGPFVQSDDLTPYEAAMSVLAAKGAVYPCELTRGEIEAASSAPQEGGPAEVRFPPELRPDAASWPREFNEKSTGWRFVVPDAEVAFEDEVAGAQRVRPLDTIGDFAVWTKRGQPSYQLAVVVDDIRHGVTHVVRGDDLLDSAARQTLLYRALGQGAVPAWCHLPLVVGEDGKRLAKRHGDTRVSTYREARVSAERVIGLMGYWCGVCDAPRPMSAAEFVAGFRLATMARERIVFSAEHDRWLRSEREPGRTGPPRRS